MNSIPAKLSIIIPARNEEKRLPACIASITKSYEIMRQKHISAALPVPELEIIVVENRSSDRTAEVARDLGCKVTHSAAKNLSMIRNTGARMATGDTIITIDADSRMSKQMLFDVANCLAGGKYIGGGVLIYPDRLSLGIFISGLALVPVALYYRISGGLFFCLKTDFDAIGGFNEELASVEDIDFAVRLRAHGKAAGKKFKTLFRSYIVTSARKFDKFGDWYFFKNPAKTIRIFKGRSQKDADEVWYDYEE